MKNKIKVIFLLSMFKLCNISAFADHWGIPKIDGQGPWNENLVISISNVKKKHTEAIKQWESLHPNWHNSDSETRMHESFDHQRALNVMASTGRCAPVMGSSGAAEPW